MKFSSEKAAGVLNYARDEILRLRKEQPRDAALPRPDEIELPSIYKKLFVIPVESGYAMLWLEGKLDDEQLLFYAPMENQMAFCVNLPENSLNFLFAAVTSLYKKGAVGLFGRTHNLNFLNQIKMRGGIVTAVENDSFNSKRFVVPPQIFQKWFAKMGLN